MTTTTTMTMTMTMIFSSYEYRWIRRLANLDEDKRKKVEKEAKRVDGKYYDAMDIKELTQRGITSIRQAAEETTRYSRQFRTDEEDERTARNLRHAFGDSTNFIQVHANISNGIFGGWEAIREICIGVNIPELEEFDDEDEDHPRSRRERLEDSALEMQLNSHAVSRFRTAIDRLPNIKYELTGMTSQIAKIMQKFFDELTERHGKIGLKVWHSPLLTDFAFTIFENVRHHGEVSGDSKGDAEISAYSRRKARELVEWIKNPEFRDILLSDTDRFTQNIRERLRDMWRQLDRLEDIFEGEIREVAEMRHRRPRLAKRREFDDALMDIEAMDPNRVKYRDIAAPMTEEELHELQFRNEVIGNICSKLKDEKTTPREIVDYVWEKCKELSNHYKYENSFYQCRIGQGNPMMGQGSGHLEIVPGKKPHANFGDIVGGNFDKVKNFVAHVKNLRKWGPLYLITSPRKSVDRNNILLIGPQGCGKTESMRAVANEDDCIAIYAQGSDFLTAWMGEAQKNPKRLFESALKLHKETEKHVHILIDEIDTVLNNDFGTGKINLSLEFQMLMDGIVEYPGISIWGTTNNPEKIPMPMIRRFSHVLIVGRLQHEHRVTLLKQFMSTMPLSDKFDDEFWSECADRLEGATGDVVRKVCDDVWRREISSFIEQQPKDAERMLRVLKQQGYDYSTGTTKKMEPSVVDEEHDQSRMGGSKKATKREQILRTMSSCFEVEPKSLELSISIALKNIGISSEIETARDTYARAEEFLAQVEDSKISEEGVSDTPGKQIEIEVVDGMASIRHLARVMNTTPPRVIKALWKKGHKGILENDSIKTEIAIEAANSYGYSIRFIEKDAG